MKTAMIWGAAGGIGSALVTMPFRMPANAMTPEAVAAAILSAYEAQHSGKLDLS